jgi:hypothetical protein
MQELSRKGCNELELAAAFHGFEHGDFVCVFDVTAGRDAGSYASDL